MSIIYIHGVSVRDPAHGVALGRSFAEWLGPKMAVGQGGVDYLPVYWGDVAARFRWNLESRPRTALLGMGAEDDAAALRRVAAMRDAGATLETPRASGGATVAADGPVLTNAPAAAAPGEPRVPPLEAVPRDQRADFLADLYLAARFNSAAEKETAGDEAGRKPDPLADPLAVRPFVAPIAHAAAAVARRWDEIAASAPSQDERAARLMRAVEAELTADGLIEQGGFSDWMAGAGKLAKRAASWPGDAVSTVFAEARPKLTTLVAYFLGDVLAYLNTREVDGRPGPIPTRVLDALEQAQRRREETGEPIVAVTHSMGGQLFFDAVNFFADARPALADLSIDHWFSCGAQVSFFAELGTFRNQLATEQPARLQRPARVAAWTNYFDRNDFIGFVMEPVFEGVKDIEYDTGYGLASAHSGFLAHASFFEAMAKRL